MPKKIRPIDYNAPKEAAGISEEEAARKNDELLKQEIAEFDRIAEDLKLKERAIALAMAKKGAAKPKKSPEEIVSEASSDAKENVYEALEDEVKAEIAKHIKAREASLRALKKAPVMPVKPVPEGSLKELRVKHVLDPVEEEDGTRLLVERVWPRFLNRKTYPMTDWQPAVGPTITLRKELADAPEDFEAFSAHYREFLEKDPAALEFRTEIRTILQVENVTFLHAAENRTENSAAVLRTWVLEG